MTDRAAARLAPLLAAAALLAGCGSLKLPGAPAPAPAAEAAAPAGEPAYALEIVAPDKLDALLERHLDLSRFRRAAGAEPLAPNELDRLVAAAPAQARALLETEGYFSAEVRVERPAPKRLRVVVEPGPRTTVGEVTIEAQGDLQSAIERGDAGARALLAKAREDWSLEPGEPFRQAAWDAAKGKLLAQLRAAGYASAGWAGTAARVDAAAARARLLAIADSGPLYRIGGLRIEGLEHHDEKSVRRLADFEPGAVASEKRLLDFQERLQTANLFDGASVELDPDPANAGHATVRVRVREAPLQQATLGLGVSANTGPRISLEHLHRRPFGKPFLVSNKLELGRDRRAWDLDVTTHPLPGLWRNLAAASVERLRVDAEVRTAWSARLGRTQQGPRIERLYFVEMQSATVVNPLGRRTGDALSANAHGTWRDLDDPVLPTRGYTFSGQSAAGFARSNFADNGPFSRLLGRLTVYRPIGSWYGQARVEAGQVFAADRVGLPDTLLFRAGGDDSVRGYAYRTLGPRVDGIVTSGRVMATGSLELAHPISARLPSLWGAVFVDAGNAADHWRGFDAAVGAGVGLRWRSPVGPLRLDLAYGDESRKFRLHFSVGIAL